MKNDSFVFYRSYEEAIDALPVKEQYMLYKAIIRMSLDDKTFRLPKVPKAMFALILPQIEANKKRYLDGCKGGEFGKLGGRPSNQKKQRESSENIPAGVIGHAKEAVPKNPTGVFKDELSETPNENENVNGNENVNENENVNGNENVNENENVNGNENDAEASYAEASYAGGGTGMQYDCRQSGLVQRGKIGNERKSPKIGCGGAIVDYDAVVGDYNRVCKSLPGVKCLTDARRAAIRMRIAEHTAEKLHEVYEKAEKSDFLCGRRPGNKDSTGRNSAENTWRASFDWLLNKANFVKVLEGNYDNNPQVKSDLDDLF
jgi:hypothetical protein